MKMVDNNNSISCTSSISSGGSISSSSSSGGSLSPQNLTDYLAQLIKDKKQLGIFPHLFLHVERLLDDEISRVRSNLFHLSGTKVEPLELPEAVGPIVPMQEKVYVPVTDHPEFNFVGRILGPRGMTAKQLEQETGCKIMVRGKGSMRDKKKEELNRGKPNWEHLNDELHVLITVEDTENRGRLKLQRAIEEIQKLLVPFAEGEDELKKRQLMELAIINGTYRDSKERSPSQQIITPQQMSLATLRTGAPLVPGQPLIFSPHAAATQQLTTVRGVSDLIYTPGFSDYAYLLDYSSPENPAVGKMSGMRRLGLARDHPYLKDSLLH